jgi:ABC-type polysaccharide/polyol phosphate export permease
MSVLDNRFLVKKVVFRVSLLPVVRLLTVVPVHLFFLAVIILIAWGYGTTPSMYYLQIPYYMAATLIIALGFALLTSALVPFFRDLSQIIMVILQIAFWLMPIVWQPGLSPGHQWLVMIDPLYYIIRGYRESLFQHTWFWTDMPATVYFWTVTTLVVVLGGLVFHRLKPHFADVI